jgi:hypothetical protein
MALNPDLTEDDAGLCVRFQSWLGKQLKVKAEDRWVIAVGTMYEEGEVLSDVEGEGNTLEEESSEADRMSPAPSSPRRQSNRSRGKAAAKSTVMDEDEDDGSSSEARSEDEEEDDGATGGGKDMGKGKRTRKPTQKKSETVAIKQPVAKKNKGGGKKGGTDPGSESKGEVRSESAQLAMALQQMADMNAAFNVRMEEMEERHRNSVQSGIFKSRVEIRREMSDPQSPMRQAIANTVEKKTDERMDGGAGGKAAGPIGGEHVPEAGPPKLTKQSRQRGLKMDAAMDGTPVNALKNNTAAGKDVDQATKPPETTAVGGGGSGAGGGSSMAAQGPNDGTRIDVEVWGVDDAAQVLYGAANSFGSLKEWWAKVALDGVKWAAGDSITHPSPVITTEDVMREVTHIRWRLAGAWEPWAEMEEQWVIEMVGMTMKMNDAMAASKEDIAHNVNAFLEKKGWKKEGERGDWSFHEAQTVEQRDGKGGEYRIGYEYQYGDGGGSEGWGGYGGWGKGGGKGWGKGWGKGKGWNSWGKGEGKGWGKGGGGKGGGGKAKGGRNGGKGKGAKGGKRSRGKGGGKGNHKKQR